MFGSTVLEVATGMIVCFGSVALIASSVQEAVASMLRWRAKTLLTGVTDLLNGQSLVLDVYNHALVNPRSDGKAATLADLSLKYAPSYIEPQNFARALVDSLQKGLVTFTLLRPVIASITDGQLRTCLLGMYDRAAGNISGFEADVARWFDTSMDRISGAYKRKAQFWTFVFALVIAVGFNVDAHQVMATVWVLTINNHGGGRGAIVDESITDWLASPVVAAIELVAVRGAVGDPRVGSHGDRRPVRCAVLVWIARKGGRSSWCGRKACRRKPGSA